MAYISFQPSDFYNTKLYTGNGSTQSITGVGFQPDFTWMKGRTTTGNHSLVQSPLAISTVAYSNLPNAPGTDTDALTAFGADGFTLGNSSGTNGDTLTFVSWNWKGGTTSGITTNGSTTITPSAYSFNQTSGFSALAYTGNATSGAKLAHGLGVTPQMVIVKNLQTANDWSVYHQYIKTTDPGDWQIHLNSNGAATDNAGMWNDTEPDAVNITLGSDNGTNGSYDYLAYAFADVKGYSKFGSYIGNGNADGTFIYTGFRPAWIVLKISNTTGDWYMYDSKRLGYNIDNDSLFPNSNQATATSDDLDILSNGFKLRSTNGEINGSGNTIIYMAFSEFPFVSSNSKAGTAR